MQYPRKQQVSITVNYIWHRPFFKNVVLWCKYLLLCGMLTKISEKSIQSDKTNPSSQQDSMSFPRYDQKLINTLKSKEGLLNLQVRPYK